VVDYLRSVNPDIVALEDCETNHVFNGNRDVVRRSALGSASAGDWRDAVPVPHQVEYLSWTLQMNRCRLRLSLWISLARA
jgi:hypothetical protein